MSILKIVFKNQVKLQMNISPHISNLFSKCSAVVK